MPAEIFLSYSRDDQPVAQRFAEALQREGFSVWWDQTLRSGEAYDEVTEQALRSARAVVVLWSKRSVASRWVRAEATIADRAGTLMPAMIEPCERPVMFELRQSADLSGWQGAADDRRWRAFVGDLRTRTGGVPEDSRPHLQPAGQPHALPVRSRKPLLVAIAALVLVIAGTGLWALLRQPERTQTSVQQRTGDAKLAVLPFIDISPAGDQEYFADGMTEEILNSLARLKGLQVSGRTSSFYFKGKNEDMKVIGEKLGVEFLLEGSVRKAGEQLRITAQLVKAADGFHLWSQTYDRSVRDVFAVQEDIARSVADALQIALGVGDLASLPGMTRNVEAYEAWMEAQSVGLVGGTTRENTERRMEKLELATTRDPGFFLAWLDLSGIYRGQAALYPDDPERTRSLRAKSRTALEEARKFVPDPLFAPLLEVSTALGRGDWRLYGRLLPALITVTDKYRRVVLTGPAGPNQFLLTVDRAAAAIDGLEKIRARDPLNTTVAIFMAEAYGDAGRLADALAEQDRGLKVAPDEVLAANALMVARAMGNAGEIEKRWEQMRSLVPNPQDLAITLYPLRNRPAEARAELRRVAAIQPRTVTASRLALWAGFFEDHELALQVLREDKDTDRRNITALAMWRPVMAGTRALPGFKDLVRDWGFVDYWREFGWGDHCKPVGDTDFQCN
jgi:TolB-like protein